MFNLNINSSLLGDTAEVNKRPIVLSVQRYERIFNNATIMQRAEKERKEEEENRESMKQDAEKIMAQFAKLKVKEEDDEDEDPKERKDKLKKEAKDAKENDDNLRREKILKAQQLVQKLSAGPRELRSAALASEVLHARNIQCAINKEFADAKRKQEDDELKVCKFQTLPFIENEQNRAKQQKFRTIQWKKELCDKIAVNTKKRSEEKNKLLKEQIAERKKTDHEIQMEIKKERDMMDKKKVLMRQTALAAMKMAEQRRQRENMTEEIDTQLCCVYRDGKEKIRALQDEHKKQLGEQRDKAIALQVKELETTQQEKDDLESARVRRDINNMQLKFTAEEEEKVRRDKIAKRMRIEAYMREVYLQKELEKRRNEKVRYDMAERLKCTEINQAFNQELRNSRIREAETVRDQLRKQIDEKNAIASQLKRDEIQESQVPEFDKQDDFFFSYARNLIEDAQQKNRPLCPFAKVVQNYKRGKKIDFKRQTPKHLVSHLSIGCPQYRSKEGSMPAQYLKKTRASDVVCDTDYKASILQNCLKIDELLGKSAKQKKNAECPIDCMRHETNNGILEMDSTNFRYNMMELKNLNQFPAPSLH